MLVVVLVNNLLMIFVQTFEDVAELITGCIVPTRLLITSVVLLLVALVAGYTGDCPLTHEGGNSLLFAEHGVIGILNST